MTTNKPKNPKKSSTLRATAIALLAGIDAAARIQHGSKVPADHPSRRR
jgi:hypothetical protein